MRQLDVAQLQYPILSFDADAKEMVYTHLKPLTKTSIEILDSGALDNLRFIDSNGIKYRTVVVKNLGWSNWFGGYSLLVKGRGIKIQTIVEEIGSVDFDSFKRFVEERSLYNPLIDSLDVEEFVQDIRESQSYEEVIRLVH